MTLQIPTSVCWPIHRVATSDRYKDGLATIEREWSVVDVLDANEVLDAYAEAQEG